MTNYRGGRGKGRGGHRWGPYGERSQSLPRGGGRGRRRRGDGGGSAYGSAPESSGGGAAVAGGAFGSQGGGGGGGIAHDGAIGNTGGRGGGGAGYGGAPGFLSRGSQGDMNWVPIQPTDILRGRQDSTKEWDILLEDLVMVSSRGHSASNDRNVPADGGSARMEHGGRNATGDRNGDLRTDTFEGDDMQKDLSGQVVHGSNRSASHFDGTDASMAALSRTLPAGFKIVCDRVERSKVEPARLPGARRALSFSEMGHMVQGFRALTENDCGGRGRSTVIRSPRRECSLRRLDPSDRRTEGLVEVEDESGDV
ncbi:unnamed protein product [Fusarium equiseti]|uniref:Uncharacterized protein n=1 Tax=Fusarium equiseti TaxID=61235 RepID=A0A8J2IZS6_FUSEQ|nr:unnamed protein product [Fusarium equiseti]